MSLAGVLIFQLLQSDSRALEVLVPNPQLKKEVSIGKNVASELFLSVNHLHLHLLDRVVLFETEATIHL
jgi:hypothetical protein